jgi:nicotinamidase-related amidase
MPSAPLFTADKCALVVIDVQDYFLAKLPLDWRKPLVDRIAWLMRVASILEIPIIATAENIASDGPLVPDLVKQLHAGANVQDKKVFGLCGQSDILEVIRKTERSECVLVGLETDVCISHSALGLLDQGFRVAAIEDATASPPPHHDAGLRRMAAGGVILTNTKGIYYEWVRDLATNTQVQSRINLPTPAGLTL